MVATSIMIGLITIKTYQKNGKYVRFKRRHYDNLIKWRYDRVV